MYCSCPFKGGGRRALATQELAPDRQLPLLASALPANLAAMSSLAAAHMGHVFAEIELSNPRRPELAPVRLRALADTGALMLCMPEHVAVQLDLEAESMREVSLADGRSASVPYVGPLKVAFEKRFCYVGALVLGDEVLLGAVPMEDMDLVVNPARRMVTVDPASPNLPHARVK